MGRSVPRSSPKPTPKPTPKPRSGLCPELLADFRIPKPPGCSQGAQRAVFCAVRVADFLAEGAGWGASPGPGGELGCQAQQVLKKIVRLASVFPSPPFRSSDFAGLRRPRLYGFHTGTRSLSNRKGTRAAKRCVNGSLVEREKGDVWNRNSCVLIDYRLWAAKSEGRPWVDRCLDHHLNLHLNLPPKPRSGLCPELLADFRIPKPPGC